jgi:hypothetical protein
MNGAQQASSNIHVIFYSFFVTSLCILNKEYVNIKEKKKKKKRHLLLSSDSFLFIFKINKQ